MWKNLPRRIEELERIAAFFKQENFKETARQIKRATKSLSTGKPPADVLRENFRKTYRSFQAKFVQKDSFRKSIFSQIDDTLMSAISAQRGRIKQKFKELAKLFVKMREASENIGVIASVFLRSKSLTKKEKYYGACVVYLMIVEGLFDKMIRVLYVLRHAANGIDVSLKDVYSKSPWELRRYLRRTLGGSDILFGGWENRHLRNAIAHSNFKYDEKTKKMNFQDVNPTGRVTYNKSLSFDQFSKYYQKIDDVSYLVNRMVMLIRVRDLIISPDVEL